MSGAREWGIGFEFGYEGSLHRVQDISGDTVVAVDSGGRVRRLRLVDVILAAQSSTPASEVPPPVMWAQLSEPERERVRERAEHVREMLTGYRSGSPLAARPGEPQRQYHPDLPAGAREAAKAAELGRSTRTIARWAAAYRGAGELGLIDGRRSTPGDALAQLDQRWVDTCRVVLDELTDQSRLSKKVVLARVLARLEREHGTAVVPVPSRAAAYVALERLSSGRGIFEGPTKAKRSIANRPVPPHGGWVPSRPGEYVLLDTTPLDVFAIAPVTGQWVPVELTVVLDAYDRCILGMRLSPRSTKSIDVAGVILEALTPFTVPSEWAPRASWPYHGIPDTLSPNPDRIQIPAFVRPGILPETIVTDHGRPYISNHVTSVCARLGISIQPARVYTPTDKGAVERFFLTLRHFVQELPGYKGPDVASRGEDPIADAVYTIPELEQILREWVATVYHLRPHTSLLDPALPGVRLSPAQKYQHGIARAGRLRIPNRPGLLLELLPVVHRKVHHYGVEIDRLRYTGPIVEKYHGRTNRATRKQSWPFFVNPDDLTHIYFHDPDDGTWHTLTWQHAPALRIPFSLDALDYAKRLAAAGPAHIDVERALADLLERWGAGRALTPTERRIAARHHTTHPDTGDRFSLSSVQRRLERHRNDLLAELTDPADPPVEDDIDDDIPDDDEFYSDAYGAL